MRQIKFRAWDGTKMVYEFLVARPQFADCLSIMINEDFATKAYNSCSEWKVMQFTGLVDKNGKDIYEGDIVEIKDKRKVIVWDTAHLCFIMVWLNRFEIGVIYRNGNPIGKSGSTYDKVTDTKKIVLIGNIYENTELIKK